MAREKFQDWKPRGETLQRLNQALDIIDEYQNEGLRMTLRQLYYQLVSRDLIANKQAEYNRLGTMLSRARLAGYVDWDAIEDRGRIPDIPSDWDSPQHLMDNAVSAYRRPRWSDQKIYTELWVEKQALAGVLEPLASEYHIPLMVNKGYSSQSAMYESARRIMRNCNRPGNEDFERRCAIVLYLGDHDPSGEDMVRDIQDRLDMFIAGRLLNSGPDGVFKSGLAVIKLALNWNQIEEYDPPPNPTKLSDSRAEAYIEKFGYESWEVDALSPPVLQGIIREALDEIVDRDRMDAVIALEEEERAALLKATRNI